MVLSLIGLLFPAIICKRVQVSSPHVHGDQIDFDCRADVDNWQRGWSVEKMQYCCKFEGKGCLTPGALAPRRTSTGERKHRRGSIAEKHHRRSFGHKSREVHGQNNVRLASSGELVDGVRLR